MVIRYVMVVMDSNNSISSNSSQGLRFCQSFGYQVVVFLVYMVWDFYSFKVNYINIRSSSNIFEKYQQWFWEFL